MDPGSSRTICCSSDILMNSGPKACRKWTFRTENNSDTCTFAPFSSLHPDDSGRKPWFLPWLSSGSSWAKTRWRWWRDCEICPTSWERCRDGGSDRANCSCCPCDEPHERVWGERERKTEKGVVGKDGACGSHQDKLEKSNFKTMSSPSKLAEAVNSKIRGGWIYLRWQVHTGRLSSWGEI